MTNQVKKAIRIIEELPKQEQEEIAKLILEELSWDWTFQMTQIELENLAGETNKEYQSGNVND